MENPNKSVVVSPTSMCSERNNESDRETGRDVFLIPFCARTLFKPSKERYENDTITKSKEPYTTSRGEFLS
jgi:hypothetical protein